MREDLRQASSQRMDRIAALQAGGATLRAIAEELGISRDRVRQLIAREQWQRRDKIELPNSARLSTRARNALADRLVARGQDRAEYDRLLPQRTSLLSRRELLEMPNIGKVTVDEIEAWFSGFGLSLRP